jgi:hypothetical protein
MGLLIIEKLLLLHMRSKMYKILVGKSIMYTNDKIFAKFANKNLTI